MITLPDRINHPGLVEFVDSSGNPISVSLASGTTTNVMFASPTSDNVTVSGNQITFNNLSDPSSSVPFDPGFKTGDPFAYLGPVSSSDSAITGLNLSTSNNTPKIYYVILTTTPGIIKLADSRSDAMAGNALSFGPSTSSLTTNINYAVPFTPDDTRPFVVTELGSIDTSMMAFNFPFTASPSSLTPQGTAGVNISATLTDSQNSFVASGIGGTPSIQDAVAKPEVAAPTINNMVQNAYNGQSNSGASLENTVKSMSGSTGTSPDLSLAGSIFVEVTPTDIVTAEVGADAKIESGTNVAVVAKLTQTVDTSTAASLTGQDGKQQSTSSGLAGALALGIGYYAPTVTAEIDSLASVDAAGTISVTATTDIPFEIPTTVNGVEGDILYNAGNPNYNLVNFLTLFLTDGMLGLGTDILNNTASAKVNTNDESRTALGGNIQFFYYANNTNATIGAAKINQQVSDPNALGPNQGIVFRNPAQSVSVSASTTYENAAEAGQFDLNLSPASLIQNIRAKGAKEGFGSADRPLWRHQRQECHRRIHIHRCGQ